MGNLNFLQPMGLWELYLRSFRIYLRNLHTLLLLGVILLLPCLIISGISALLWTEMESAFGIIFYILSLITFYAAFFYFYAGATLAVSLNIIGLKAGIVQILRRIGGKIGIQLLGTGLLQTLILFGGLLVLIIPGIIWFIRFIFALPIVVLERTPYDSALIRSQKLVEGSWWRLFGALWVNFIGFHIIGFVFAITPFILLTLSGIGQETAAIFALLAFYFAMPLLFIYPILLYYDIRVRKEAINVETVREGI